EAGMGKSRLLAEALAQQPRALAIKAQAGDAGVPYATLARLLRRLMQPAGRAPDGASGQALARLLPELGSGCAAIALPGEGARLLLLESVQALLARAGLDTLAVDDLQFADAASLELLHSLIGSENPLAIAWLLAQRPGEGGPAAQALHDGLVEAGRLQPLVLAPLDRDQVADLVHSLGLPGLDATALAPRLHRHTGGNPLFVLETLKQMQAADAASSRLPASATVGALIERRLRALDGETLALARLAAIAGPDFSPALAEQVTGRPALALADAWAALEAAQVLRDNAFAHDLVLEATLRGIPQPIAQHLHAAVARHLQHAGAEPARLAAHWLAARDETAALPWLLKAAEAARAGLRPREQSEFLRRAAALPPSLFAAGERFELLMRLQEAESESAGPADALRRLLEAEAAASQAPQRARVLARRASLLAEVGDYGQAVSAGEQALSLAIAWGDTALLAESLATAASARAIGGQPQQAEDLMA
ncbi:MAG: AAA family ATPase, partial [Rubrivivax sp.]|nr:AAA family ATPase [Rubrivivax sp.]